MKIGDLIGVRDFPSVVQAADVRALRESKNDAATRDFVAGYIGFDERARRALEVSLVSLFQSQAGGAFFLNGVFGSGKSHLLGLLALLCDGSGHDVFTATHPQLAPLLKELRSRLVVHFSLDDYNAAQLSLEAIAHREIEREWQRRFGGKLEVPHADSRSEYFAALDEALLARGCHGLVVCIDELSLFLSAKDHAALQADAAFLQFLGQRAARAVSLQGGSTPGTGTLHVFAAIQKTIDDIGDIEAYSLSQIRDRFQTLPLSLAHLPSLVSHRLIIHKNPSALQGVCRDSYQETARALPRLDFALSEWEMLFPFHPATIALLEKVVARFFSRTRSAAIFCAHAAREILPQEASARVLPASIFDYFLPELEIHPVLRPLAEVWRRWHSEIPELAADATEAQTLSALMKTLLVFKIAGVAPTAIEVANALLLDAKLPGDGNIQYAQVLLERIAERGSHLAVERNSNFDSETENNFSDRYSIDWGTRISELVRRHLKNTVSELQANDTRIATYVASCCRDETVPLSTPGVEQTVTIFWQNAPREIAVQTFQATPKTDWLSNRLAMLAQPDSREDLLLLIAAPFAQTFDFQSHNFQSHNFQSQIQNPQFVVWTPRAPTEAEIKAAREATAAHLLEDDPQLSDNRRGRAIAQFLKDARATRESQMAQLARRLLREGVIRCGDHRVLEAGELAGENTHALLESIAEFAFPAVFPNFETIAPRARVLTPGNADSLCLEILRRPASEPYFAASLERLVRALAQPLGIAVAEKGRWKIGELQGDLREEFKAFVGDGSTPGALAAHFAKSDWGLKTEQTNLAICALLRSGELTAQGAKGQILSPAQIGMPLRRSVQFLQPGKLLDAESWAKLQKLISLLTDENLAAPSFAAQESARQLLIKKRDEMQAAAELFQARLRQLQRALNHSPAQWPQAESTLQSLAGVLENLSGETDTNRFLQHAIAIDTNELPPLLARWQKLQEQLEARHADLLSTHRLLTHPRLAPPPELQKTRAAILEGLQSGEAILEDAALPELAADWRREYSRLYKGWHAAQHDAARWNSLRRLQNSDELRALDRLAHLQSRPFPHAAQMREALQTELHKQCPRDGNLLPGEATCNVCDLAFGERVFIRDAREIEAIAADAIIAMQAALQEESARASLARQNGSTPVLDWNGEAQTLLPLLTDETLAALEIAFKPRRRVTRKLADLQAQFSTCRTRAEFETAFQKWINDTEHLAADDEIGLV
jgi:hypothetical protein